MNLELKKEQVEEGLKRLLNRPGILPVSDPFPEESRPFTKLCQDWLAMDTEIIRLQAIAGPSPLMPSEWEERAKRLEIQNDHLLKKLEDIHAKGLPGIQIHGLSINESNAIQTLEAIKKNHWYCSACGWCGPEEETGAIKQPDTHLANGEWDIACPKCNSESMFFEPREIAEEVLGKFLLTTQPGEVLEKKL